MDEEYDWRKEWYEWYPQEEEVWELNQVIRFGGTWFVVSIGGYKPLSWKLLTEIFNELPMLSCPN